MSDIRRDVSRIIGFTIPTGKTAESFALLRREGKLSQRHIEEILVLLIEREEAREKNTSLQSTE